MKEKPRIPLLFCLLVVSGAAALLVSSASAGTGVTISADGDHSYYLGEKVVLRGQSDDAESILLYLAGPTITEVNPFGTVKAKPDKTWEYSFYTANIAVLPAGTYTLYAVDKAKRKDQLDPAAASAGISLKKPFITANVSSREIAKGEILTVSGTAEGIPPAVRIWILGPNGYFRVNESVKTDASFSYEIGREVTGTFENGQYFVIAQHPMQDNRFDIDVNGEYVRNMKLNNGTDIFRITGADSLQGSDAADALIAAFNDLETKNTTDTGSDTYTIIPFVVTDSGPFSGVSVAGVLAEVTEDPGAKPFVSVVAQGSRSYYLGEKVILRGRNTDSDSTYLFITGPNMPPDGGALTAPRQSVVSGTPDSFTVVKTKADKTWEYAFYTASLPCDAGTYTLYAVSRPVGKNQFGESANYGTASIILKKPFIAADVSSKTIAPGQPFTVSGTAEGDPPSVQIWILGQDKWIRAIEQVNPDASFRYSVLGDVTKTFSKGQYFVIVQHPMRNSQFDIDVSGDYVRNMRLNNGSDIFRIAGPDSLQGSDAADALVSAFSNPETYEDTYTIIPFQVTDSGSPEPEVPDDAEAVPTRQAPLQYAMFGGTIVAAAGFVIRNRD